MNPEQNPQAGNTSDASSRPQVIGPQQSPVPTGIPSPIGPTPPTLAPAMGTPPTEPEKPKRRFRFNKRVVAFVVILLIGLTAGAFAYWQTVNNSPEKVLADALVNTLGDVLDRKPTHLVGTLKVESKDQASPFTLTVDIDAKQANENGQFSAKVHFDAKEFEVSVNASSVTEGSEAIYVKLDNLRKTVDDLIDQNPEVALYAGLYDPIINKLDGRWIKIDEQGLMDMGLTQSEEKIDKCSEELEKLRISKDDQARVKEIFQKNQFAIASEELPAEDVDGDSSFHYKLDLNEDAAVQFVKEFIELPSFAGVKEACDVKPGDIEKNANELKEQTGDEEVQAEPVFELWVSRGTRRPTKFKVTLDDKEVSMENITTVKLNAQNVHVEIPTDFITLKDLQAEIEKTFSSNGLLGWSDLREEIQ